MKQHDLTLASTRVHTLDLYPRKAQCLRSIFHLLCRFRSCGLDTSQSSTKSLHSSICIELIMALTSTIPQVNPPLSLIFTSILSVPSYDVALDCSPHLISKCICQCITSFEIMR
ncbi:hypothetical protein B296_00051566 [Ensete ventricosum]|uniref:Uncharacterized protein n=1 Tax=Ensete ventricosum TaxID=4639 RepID=A0A426YG41_ENSVE|nr:hypothetical protein B296_00051566 [Ensete ventricosum]